jgi:predicted O-methyltransferase YrrM
MHPIIEEIYRTNVVRDASGNEYPLDSGIDSAEGDYLSRIIASDISIRNTLEVGCAYGLSSLYICDAIRHRSGPSHTIIDPKEMNVWHGVGVAQLKRAGIDFFELIAEPSELALPALLRQQPASFDLIFIDGWHTFDQVMLDMYYANLLVRNGGYVVMDDCQWVSVSAAVSYYLNYPAYTALLEPRLAAQNLKQRIARAARTLVPPRVARLLLPEILYDRPYRRMSHPSMVALKKVSEDSRSWTWFKGF